MKHDNNSSRLGYTVGKIFGCVVMACIAALIVALTTKLIFLMF